MMEIPKEYQMTCRACGQTVDIRDLSQVFAHEPCDGAPKYYDKIEKLTYSGSRKIGDPILWTKDKKPIHLS